MRTRKTTIVALVGVAFATFSVIGMLSHNAKATASVIFRLDDVQDFYANNGTKAVMDLFSAKHVPLTTAVIASAIGKDPGVTDKTAQGLKSGLFELALHGYRHVDYTKLTPNNQSVSITQGNKILKALFGQHPFVFVPPFNTFNNATLGALKSHDMNVISSTIGTEANENSTSQIYNGTEACGTSDSGVICPTPLHISAGNDFRLITDQNITQQTNAQLMSEIANNVKHYGYSVLVLHPQDFVYTDPHTGKIVKNAVNVRQLSQLNALIDQVKARYTPSSMEALVSTMGTATFEVLAKKPVIITLDDDWIGQFKYAIPILRHYGFNATFFVTCQGPIQQAPSFMRGKSPDITTWAQLKAIKSMGFDIQNHGMTHHSLIDQPKSILQREIVDSKQCLDSHLGIKSRVYAPAYAGPENNQTIDDMIAAHYDFARNGYGHARFDSGRYDLLTDSMNSLDKQFNHNTPSIMGAFVRDVQKAQLPVLVYHNVNNLSATDRDWYNSTTTPETFDAEMKWLHDNNYAVHAIADLHWDGKEFTFQ
jgi:peptidoglycan/xylan/chitin deacetylase (PgdA/CDA1 family)